ncbi:unnamed protein product [Periconia digitata]|uniref:NAD(P)-binding protein n=1 Tax=Periconia digitata TaxID=1303443 RepID=A0A9W4XNS6_9PLEO|nr:unnamed protein product [Periconia digitata]
MSALIDIFKAMFFGGGIRKFNPAVDIPSLAGKVILVTGANAGIGKQTAIELAQHQPAEIWIGARNVQSGNEAASEIKAVASPETIVNVVQMDLSSLASVKTAAKQVVEKTDRMDILLLNAGMMAGPPGVTEDGYEKQFATNFVGHALLLKLLTPNLLRAAQDPKGATEPRVVILSSAGHKASVLPKEGIDFSTLKTDQMHMGGMTKYCQSKLADAVYAAPIAKRYPQFTTVAINPGEVLTDLFNKGKDGGGRLMALLVAVVLPLIGKPVTEGCKNSLWSATSSEVESGRFYDPIGKTGAESENVKNGKLGERLWEWTESELNGHTL